MIPALVLLNLGVGLTGYFIYSNLHSKYEVRMTNGRIEMLSASQLQEYVDKQSRNSMINIQMNTSPEFENGGKQGDLYIANAYGNKRDMRVEIYVKDNLVFKIDKLKPGKVIASSGLQKELPKGDYSALAKVFFFQDDGTKEMENQVDLQLHVKS